MCVFSLFSFRDYIQKPTAKEEYTVITQYWSIQKKSPILRWVFLSPKEYMQVLTLSDLHRSELIGKGFDSNLKYQLIYKFPWDVSRSQYPHSFYTFWMNLTFLKILSQSLETLLASGNRIVDGFSPKKSVRFSGMASCIFDTSDETWIYASNSWSFQLMRVKQKSFPHIAPAKNTSVFWRGNGKSQKKKLSLQQSDFSYLSKGSAPQDC